MNLAELQDVVEELIKQEENSDYITVEQGQYGEDFEALCLCQWKQEPEFTDEEWTGMNNDSYLQTSFQLKVDEFPNVNFNECIFKIEKEK